MEDIDEDEEVLGYVLFADDTRAFEDALERDWFPPLRAKYPKFTDDALTSLPTYDKAQLSESDKRYISLLHAPGKAPDACVAFSPAHLVRSLFMKHVVLASVIVMTI